MTTPEYDIAAVVAALFTAWLGPKLGPVLGIYSVIVIAAVIGAGFALVRKPPEAITWPALFVTLLVGATVIVTVPITLLLVPHLPVLTVQVAIPLVALAIAAIGPDWLRVFAWGWGFARRWIGQRTGVGPGGDTGTGNGGAGGQP